MPHTLSLVDLAAAVIWTPPQLSGAEVQAVELLRREVQKRTLIRWPDAQSGDPAPPQVIRIGSMASLQGVEDPVAQAMRALGAPTQPESYRVKVEADETSTTLSIVGADARGVLYGVGHLLRHLRMSRNSVTVPATLDATATPAYALRGHQLGYRDKTNSYDGWDLAQWEQYICDLAVFGANAIEVMPPRTDDNLESIHFPLPPLETMVGVSALAQKYGLDLWIWYPALDEEYTDPATVEFALQEWGEVFAALPLISAVMVPGGDPGHAPPRVLMALLEKQTQNLQRFHPAAQMWVSPQGYSDAWMDEFLGMLSAGVDWLTGVVYGPWVYGSMEWFRGKVPARYPIRNYPDITHTLDCQLPVPEWDVAYALTEGREVINPRPVAQAQIFRHQQPDTIGFLSYSEGCHDDVNKMVWSRLGWEPDADVTEILREYGRYFIGAAYADGFAQGLMALERNWQGALATNRSVDVTLLQFQSMEREAAASAPFVLKNWRFLQALYRATYDAYVRSRLLHAEAVEDAARHALAQAGELGSTVAVARAEEILDRALFEQPAQALRLRLFQLAEALFQSPAHMQLRVHPYGAQEEVRGASLDGCDFPLNDREWLKERFADLRKLDDEGARLAHIGAILNWCDPGPGGFYDDLSAPWAHTHLAPGRPFADDPDFMTGPLRRFPYRKVAGPLRKNWRTFTGPWHFHPMQMHYQGLDPHAPYQIKVLYSIHKAQVALRLTAAPDIEVHPYILPNTPQQPAVFDVPAEATASGELLLTWEIEHGRGGNPGGAGISEIWLMRREP